MQEFTPSEYCNEVIEQAPLLQPHHMLEEMIYELTEDKVDEVAETIKSLLPDEELSTVYKLIGHASIIRPFIWHQLGDLWSKFGNPDIDIRTTPFTEYLFKRKIIKLNRLINPPRLPFTIEEFELGFDVNSVEAAIKKDDLDQLSILSIESDLRKNVKLHRKEMSTISMAAYFGSLNVFKYLMLNGIPITVETAQNAVKGGNEEILQLVMEKNLDFSSLLKTAIEYHRNDIIKWLIESGFYEQISLNHCIRSINTLAFTYFLINGSDVNQNENGLTPLLLASERGRNDIVQFLIEKGADITFANDEGDCAFTRAAVNNHFNVLKTLFAAGLDVNTTFSDGTPVICRAAKDGMQKLIDFLISNGVSMESVDKDNSTPLMLAASSGHEDIVLDLISRGADMYHANKYNYTALVWAAENDFPDVVKIFIEKGDMTKMNYQMALERGRSVLSREYIEEALQKL